MRFIKVQTANLDMMGESLGDTEVLINIEHIVSVAPQTTKDDALTVITPSNGDPFLTATSVEDVYWLMFRAK